MIAGGGPVTSIRKQSKLIPKYAEYGYGSSPLLFTELSACGVWSFGMLSRGPDFAIYKESSD